MLLLGFAARGAVAKAVWVNLRAAMVALALAEVYFWNTKVVKANTYCCDDRYFVRDDLLGVVPRKSFAASHVKTANTVPLYTVTYTIDANGLRIPPPQR